MTTKYHEKNMRYIQVAVELIEQVLREGVRNAFRVTQNSLPDDGEVTNVMFNGRTVTLTVVSEKWLEPCLDGKIIAVTFEEIKQ